MFPKLHKINIYSSHIFSLKTQISDIYNVQTHNTKYYLLSLPFFFFNDI